MPSKRQDKSFQDRVLDQMLKIELAENKKKDKAQEVLTKQNGKSGETITRAARAAFCKLEQKEMVNHPAHYGGDTVYEVIKVLNAWGLEYDALLWNAVKYIARAGKKSEPLEDLKKAAWYLNRRIEKLEHK